MKSVEEIMANLKVPQLGAPRYAYDPGTWDMDTMLEVVTRIGKAYEPRFVLDSANVEVYQNLIHWLMGSDQMTCIDPISQQPRKGNPQRGIYLAGGTGTGKSLAMEVIGTLARKGWGMLIPDSKTPAVYEWNSTRTDYLTDTFAIEGAPALMKAKTCKVCCFNDLGAEPQEVLYMGNRINVMQQVIESRGDRHDLVTLFTSNLGFTQNGTPRLKERYGARSVSRLMDMCNYLELRGADRRLKR